MNLSERNCVRIGLFLIFFLIVAALAVPSIASPVSFSVPVINKTVTTSSTVIWVIIAIILLAPVAVATIITLVTPKPVFRVDLRDVRVELWVKERSFPSRAQAIIAPVSPDLKMVFGISKVIRDYTADAVQREAEQVAPLEPGEAFVGTGGKYRFRWTALAVIFDVYKRTTSSLITKAYVRAIQLTRSRGATTCVIPDITENLLRQPRDISAEERRQSATIAAKAVVEAIMATRGSMRIVKIWVWDQRNAESFLKTMKSLESGEWSKREQSVSVRNAAIAVLKADVTQIAADAILFATDVNLNLIESPVPLFKPYGGAASSPLTFSSPPSPPLSSRLVEAGGPEFENAVKAADPIGLGEACITAAGKMKPKRVVHIAVRSEQFPARADTFWKAIQNGLKLADNESVQTIAIPHLGTGENNYPPDSLAPLTVGAVTEYLKNGSSGLCKIWLVASNDLEEAEFEKALGDYIEHNNVTSRKVA